MCAALRLLLPGSSATIRARDPGAWYSDPRYRTHRGIPAGRQAAEAARYNHLIRIRRRLWLRHRRMRARPLASASGSALLRVASTRLERTWRRDRQPVTSRVQQWTSGAPAGVPETPTCMCVDLEGDGSAHRRSPLSTIADSEALDGCGGMTGRFWQWMIQWFG